MSLWANIGKKKKCRQELETNGEQQVIDWNSFVLHKKEKKIRRDYFTALLSAEDRKKTYTVSGRRRWMSLVGVQMKQ
jgi:hypothetical protein